jgi:replication factor C subunit 3/5
VIEPVRSRCLGVRIAAPSAQDLAALLLQVARKENMNLTPELGLKIAMDSDRNVRRALLMLEAAKMQIDTGRELAPTAILLPDWELYIARLARELLAEQTPSKLLLARDMLYELLTNCIPAEVILSTLTKELMKSLDDVLKHELAHWAAYYDARLRQGSKDIFHLEAFAAKFMALYKKWIIALFG